jgi:hypothetical protein
MKRDKFEIALPIVDRMDKLQKTIFELQEIQNKNSYKIIAYDNDENETVVELKNGNISTEVFIQDILEYYINTLNLELNELQKTFDEL